MTAPTHAAVWLDHAQARVYHVDRDGFDEKTLRAPAHHFHRHPKGSTEGHAHPDDERKFFGEIARALAPVQDVLVLGPSTAKNELVAYLREHARPVAEKVVAVESADHPSDAQVVDHVRRHFRIPEPPRVR